MRLSIVIAAYNEGASLRKTIESCIETSSGLDGQYEIVVADDASDDDSVEAVARRFLQVRIHRCPKRQGTSATKAAGAQQARGDVLLFLDGHTKPEYGAIKRLIEDVQELEGQAIVTPAVPALDVTTWKSDRNQVGNGYSLDLETFDCGWLPLQKLTPVRESGKQFYESPALIGCAVALSRELYDRLLGFDAQMKSWGVEDLDLGLRCWLMGFRILHDPQASIAHRFQSSFNTYSVPIEHILVNQLRMARKNFTSSVSMDWTARCRQRMKDCLSDHPEGLWAHAWRLFTDDLASVEQERSYLRARLNRDEFWYAERFRLPWPSLRNGLSTQPAALGPSPSPQPSPLPPGPSPKPSSLPPLGYDYFFFGGPGGTSC
jgi:glycosyltransferase involved in cell wall biosynthesis